MKKIDRMICIASIMSYLFILIGCSFFAWFYRQTFFYLLLIFIFCIPFLSFYISKYCFMKLTPTLSFLPLETKKGQEARVQICMQNPLPLPFSSVSFTFSLSSSFYEERSEKRLFIPIRPNNDNLIEYPATVHKCGAYIAEISHVTGYDFTHIFCFHKDVSLHTTLHVLPHEPKDIAVHETIYSEGFDEFEESNGRGNVSSNVTDIREYQPGDRLQKIHWKLSTKIDKLMVKENEATSTHEFFVLLELFQPTKENCKTKEDCYILDRALEEAYGLCEELLLAGEIFSFAIYSMALSDFVITLIRTKDDLISALKESFYEKSYDTKDLALEIYEKSGMKKGTLLHVNHEGVTDVPTEF